MVFLMVYGTAFLFTRMYRKNSSCRGKVLVRKTAVMLLVALVAAVGCFALRGSSQLGMAKTINALHQSNSVSVSSDASTSASQVLVTIGRDGNYEISSGRWIPCKKPWCFIKRTRLWASAKEYP